MCRARENLVAALDTQLVECTFGGALLVGGTAVVRC